MAVEHTMAGLNTTWWDLLKEIAGKLNCTYAVLWTQTDDGRSLVWKVGYFHMLSNDEANGELFHSLYSTCTFTPGVGFAGHALLRSNDIFWMTGAELDSLEYPVAEQTIFMKTADIQTVVCLPLGLPSTCFVMELGTVRRVLESEDLGRNMKSYLLDLRARGLSHLFKGNLGTNIAAVESGYGQVPAGSNESPSLLAISSGTPLQLVRPASAPSFFSVAGFGEELLLKAQRELQSNIYSELMQPIEREETFARQQMHAARRNSNIVPPQHNVVVEIPGLPTSSAPRPGEVFESAWETEASLLQMELNSFQSWTSMADTTSTLEVAIPALPETSSGTASRPAGELVDLNDEIDQMIPFSTANFDHFMGAAAGQGQQQRQQLIGVRRESESSSRSLMSLRSQTMEDSAISSAILESYADCHISNIDKARPRVRGGNVVSSNTTFTTEPAEPESQSIGRAQQSSEPSSKETSPDSNVPPPAPFGHGIHPRISSTTRVSQKQLQAQLLARVSSASGGPSFTLSGSGSGGSSPQMTSHGLGRQFSGTLRLQRLQQEEDLKQAATSGGADSAPRLVQFGNVLQLGNSSGQVTEALPQEHDEAAVSHMLAERRRRNRQNEIFSQLKFLIPAAAKMDKASLLAATISYIHELNKRVQDLELDNQNLKSQLLGYDIDRSQSSSEGFLASVGAIDKGKESPTHFRARSPTSPADMDKIQVLPDGDGNLLIEIRNAYSQPEGAVHIFACLKEMHFKIINFTMALNDNRIQAIITTKMKRKNLAGQNEVCAEVQQTLLACLKNLA